MKIYLLDNNEIITNAWAQYFSGVRDVEIVKNDINAFLTNHQVDAIATPANSKGIMEGDYDKALLQIFGEELAQTVRGFIEKKFGGVQPVSSVVLIDIPDSKTKLIHCPIVAKSGAIIDAKMVNDCMASIMNISRASDFESVVIPGLGGKKGNVNPNDIAREMYDAYRRIVRE